MHRHTSRPRQFLRFTASLLLGAASLTASGSALAATTEWDPLGTVATAAAAPDPTAGRLAAAGVVDAAQSTVSLTPSTLVSGQRAQATLTVTLRDSGGAPVSNKEVTLLPNAGSDVIFQPSSAITGASGVVSFAVTATAIGTSVIAAFDVSDSVRITQTVTLEVAVTAPAPAASGDNGASSSVTASPTLVTANGSTTATITVVLRDGGGTPLAERGVSLVSSRASSDVIRPRVTSTNEIGAALFAVSSTVAGTSVFTAYLSSGAALEQTAIVVFTSAVATGVVDAGVSTISISPASITAGQGSGSVTVTLRDSSGAAVAGHAVTLASTRGVTDVVTPASAVTNAAGMAYFGVSSLVAGTAVFAATDTNTGVVLAQTAVLTVTAGAAIGVLDPGGSTLSVSPASLVAGQGSAGVTVTLRDTAGGALAGHLVSLASSRGGNDAITPSQVATNGAGAATFSVSSSLAGVAVLSATDLTAGVTLNPSATVVFNALASSAVDAGLSTVTVSPASVVAGQGTAIVSVTLRSSGGAAVAGKVVALRPNAGSDAAVSPTSAITDAAGNATFTVSAVTVGATVLTAVDLSDGVSLTQTATVTFTFTGASGSVPVLIGPDNGVQLGNLGPVLQWTNGAATTWYQIQVAPAKNDGPAIDLVIGDPALVQQGQYQVQAPNFGAPVPNYVILPGMTYTWRVSSSSTLGTPSEQSWTAWSTPRTFRTGVASSASITPVSPLPGATAPNATPTLAWANTSANVFYYEVQVSRDISFGAGAGSPPLYWELRHGGVTSPLNSYAVPAAFPLQPATTYYWRVRPRVQGDGTPPPWSATWSFATGGVLTRTITAVAGNQAGTPADLRVQVGDVLTFAATGAWCWGTPAAECSGPAGTDGRPHADEKPVVFDGAQFGTLLGRVGSWTFPIGTGATVTSTAAGELTLVMNDRVNSYWDNTGSLSVDIRLERK